MVRGSRQALSITHLSQMGPLFCVWAVWAAGSLGLTSIPASLLPARREEPGSTGREDSPSLGCGGEEQAGAL